MRIVLRVLGLAGVLVAALGAAGLGTAPARADESCEWAGDGVCDETRFGGTGACAERTDTADCRGVVPGPDSCAWANDGACDYPGRGSGACPPGTDTADCRRSELPPDDPKRADRIALIQQYLIDFGLDPGPVDGDLGPMTLAAIAAYAERRGLGSTPAPDSALLFRLTKEIRVRDMTAARQGTNDSCRYANDGECDEGVLGGTGACDVGTDVTDCRLLASGGDNSCEYAYDQECDEPLIGTDICVTGSDTADCGPVAHLRGYDNTCRWAFDGECDQPGQGTGACDVRTDRDDCLGRATVAGIQDYFGGYDDRVVIVPSTFPWRAVGSIDGTCTGSLVAEDVVITAAHCLYVDDEVVPPLRFYAGESYDGRVEEAAVIDHYLPPEYDPEDSSAALSQYDFAFLRLGRPIGRTVGFIPILEVADKAGLDAVLADHNDVDQAGYSWDGGDHLTGHLGCTVAMTTPDNTLFHTCDTTKGDSGSPLLIQVDGEYRLLAVDSKFDVSDDGETRNLAVDAPAFLSRFRKFRDQP